jgi:hypothetical protein
MTAKMGPRAGSTPRRARHLIPTGLPRRAELIAVCAVAVVVVHLLLAQLTLVLTLVFAATGKGTRWRTWWLLGPVAAGLAWTLAAGPGNAVAGFAAGPASILRYLGEGRLAGHLGHPLAAFGGIRGWLPRQFPVALICGAAEAALIGWLDWLHTDEWAVPPPRPGAVAAARRAVTAHAIRAGAVVTRQGCALGVVPSSGAVAELCWADASRGVLVVGAAEQDVALAGLQVVHAALRRRKPVIVLDPGGDTAVARTLGAACAATGVPLLTTGSPAAAGSPGAAGYAVQVAGATGTGAGSVDAPGASGLWGRGTARVPPPGDLAAVDPGRAVRERTAALLPADSAELAVRACTELVSLAGELRRIGIDGDALVWVPYGERVPAQALTGLLCDGRPAGLSVLIGTTSPTAATRLCGLTGTVLVYRVADPDLAASLAARTGTRLVPRPLAAAQAGQRVDTGQRPPAPGAGYPGYPSAAAPASVLASEVTVATAADLGPSPVVPARTLLTLGRAEFVLAVGRPGQPLTAFGRMVPARLPRSASSQGRRAQGTRA